MTVPPETRGHVLSIVVPSVARTVPAHSRCSVHVFRAKHNGDKEVSRPLAISCFVFGPLVAPVRRFGALIAHPWLLLL